LQYSLKVIFISLWVRLQYFAAFGRFHLAVNSISIDLRVSALNVLDHDNAFSCHYVMLQTILCFVNCLDECFWGFLERIELQKVQSWNALPWFYVFCVNNSSIEQIFRFVKSKSACKHVKWPLSDGISATNQVSDTPRWTKIEIYVDWTLWNGSY